MTPPPVDNDTPPENRPLSMLLAVLIGFAGCVFIAFIVYWYEVNVHECGIMPQMVIFSLTPISFFMAFLLAGAVNPILHKVAPALALGRREVMIVFVLWLMAGVVGFRTLTVNAVHIVGHTLNEKLVHVQATRETEVLDYLPQRLFLPEDAAETFYYGYGKANRWVPPTRGVARWWAGRRFPDDPERARDYAENTPVPPWGVWVRPMLFWGPFMLAGVVLMASLVRMMHRQWSRHELIAYPIAEVADGIVQRRPGRAFPDSFYHRGFWCGFGIVAFIYALHGLNKWFATGIYIPIEFEHRYLTREFAFLHRYCGSSYALFRGWWWPFMTAIAVLLPREVSLSAWLGYVLTIFAYGGVFFVTGQAVTGGDQGALHTGMYVAAVAMTLYTGRREYGRILKMAFTARPRRADPLHHAVVACRWFLVSFAALTGMLIWVGVHWMIALFSVMSLSLLTILLARMTAEVGIPWLAGMAFLSHRLPMRFLGPAALGPKSMTVLFLFTHVLDGTVGNSIAAQETTYGKLVENSPCRNGAWLRNAILIGGLILTMGATVFFTVWNGYSFGGAKDYHSRSRVRLMLKTAADETRRFEVEGLREELEQQSAGERLSRAQQPPRFWKFFVAGLVVVGGCFLLRHRYAWWPIHPLPLLLVNTWTLSRLYHSFMLGWLIKTALVKVGGGEFYRRSRPFFFGAVYGQIVTCGVLMAIEILYHYFTGGIRPPLMRYFA